MNKLSLVFAIAIISVISGCGSSDIPTANNSSNTQNKSVETTSTQTKIDVEKDNEAIKALLSNDASNKSSTIDKVLNSPNDFNPPVLYSLSKALFDAGRKDDAMYWFYVAQLRARYDSNLTTDQTARSGISTLNDRFGPDINKYAFQDPEKLEQTVTKVVDFVRSNEENYDHRWLSLHGLDALQSGMKGDAETAAPLKPKEQWAKIKSLTIDEYFEGFKQAMKKVK